VVISADHTLRLDDLSPLRLSESEAEDRVETILTLKSSVEENLVSGRGSGMVRDLARTFSIVFDSFPRGRVHRVLAEGLHSTQVESPHG